MGLNIGHPPAMANRDEAPTNTEFSTTSGTDGDFISTVVLTDDSLSASITIGLEKSNLANTKGFRIKCDDDGSNLLTLSSFGTVDYFVLIHSDDDKKHHFAKITKLLSEDNGNGTTTGDAFEFEPKLGNEIPKGTRYRIITGINDTNNKIVALSVGLKQNSSSADLKENLVCARPLFYFFNDRLDKKNQLDHNTKYYALNQISNSSTFSIAQNNTNGQVFRTIQDFGSRVIDYSKYSLTVTMTDVLRGLDSRNGFTSTTSNEGGSITINEGDYNEIFINARRSSDNKVATRDSLGDTRYLHYSNSPEKCNLLSSVVDSETKDSINQGSYSETKIIDNGRIMNKKIKPFDKYKVRNLLHRGNLDTFVALRSSFVSSSTDNSFDIRTDYDLNSVLNVGDEIKIQDTIMIVNSIASPFVPNTLQNITVRAEKKKEGHFVYSSISFTPTEGDLLHRRAYNPTDNTIITNINLINKEKDLEIAFSSQNKNGVFADVTAVDSHISMITISYTGESYYSNPLDFIKGDYILYSMRFDGEIEQINTTKEDSQTYLEIKGRDKLNKLLSPIINTNTAFTEDIIYSTNSPFNKGIEITYSGSNNANNIPLTVELGDTEIRMGDFASNWVTPTVGSHIYSENGLIGEVASIGTYNHTGNQYMRIVLTSGALTSLPKGDTIFYAEDTNFVFNKALGSSLISSVKPTSLNGTAAKGVIFTSGKKINSSTGAEEVALPNTSSNSHTKAIGYEINSPSNILSDSSFQCLLKDETETNTISNFDTVNTLSDFEVVSVSSNNNLTRIELAPYIPITLGRCVDYQKTDDVRIETNYVLGCTITAVGAVGEDSVIITNNANQGAGFSNIQIGEPLYANQFASGTTESYGFVGYVLDIQSLETPANFNGSGNPASNTTVTRILVDRTHTTGGKQIDFDIGDEIYISQRHRNHINLINEAHIWGGKILTIPHHKLTTNGLVFFNMEHSTLLTTNSPQENRDFNSVFGNPYYKIINADNTRLGTEPFIFSSGTHKISNKYGSRKGNVDVNFTAYKFKPNVSTTPVIQESQQFDSGLRQMPLDKRGNNSIYGSKITAHRREYRDDDLSIVPSYLTGRFLTIGASSNHHQFQGNDDSFSRFFLFINSDRLPSSSLRTDSIFHIDGSGNATKKLNDYNLFLFENKKIFDTNSNLELRDSNYQTISFTTETDITQLKRLGLLRLTECVFDEHFNLVNPEEKTDKIAPINTATTFNVDIYHKRNLGVNITGYSGNNSITFSSAVNLKNGTELYSVDNKFVGLINNGSSPTNSTTHTITQGHMPNFQTPVISIHAVEDEFVTNIGGRKEADSIFGELTASSYHPLKGAIIPFSSDYNYGQSGNDTSNSRNNGNIGFSNGSELLLPSVYTNKFRLNSVFTGNGNHNQTTSFVLTKVSGGATNQRNPYGGLIGVILKTYSIEDGTGDLSVGDTTEVLGTSGVDINAVELGDSGANFPNPREVHAVTSNVHFKNKLDANAPSLHNYAADNNRASPADGAYLGFKLRLKMINGQFIVTDRKSSNGVLKSYLITLSENNLNTWLEFVDLTGCYLMAEKDSGVGNLSEVEDNLNGKTGTPIYIYSHESGGLNNLHNKVRITTSSALSTNMTYRILQPNPICMHSTHPEEIQLNTMKAQYSKKANIDQMYEERENNYFFKEGGKQIHTSGESVLSMFVLVDTDKQSGSGELIVPHTVTNTILPTGEYEMYFSDGESSIKTAVVSTESEKHLLKINKRRTLKGIVSMSETFVVETLQSLDIEPSRACIGTTVTVGIEAETLINDLLEEENITYDQTSSTYPLFLAPKFTGVSLFSAINYILERKDLNLIIEENSFKTLPRENPSFRSNILIDDSKIIDYETVQSTFDFYNHIVVYGSSHKSDRKNLQSIKKIGKKTLEVVDTSLITQQETDKKSSELLLLHSTFNTKIKVKVIPTGQEQLRAGDIIQFESKQENILLDNYIVLEVTHPINGFITVDIGRYSKKLEDIFSQLLLQTQSNSNSLRQLSYNPSSLTLEFLEKIKLKEISILIRTRAASGFAVLGFSTTLNTNTSTLGFGGGTIVYNNLLQEELL